jgi:hypothetical protein
MKEQWRRTIHLTSEKVSTNGGGCSRATINLAISAQRMKFLLKNFSSGDKLFLLLVPPPCALLVQIKDVRDNHKSSIGGHRASASSFYLVVLFYALPSFVLGLKLFLLIQVASFKELENKSSSKNHVVMLLELSGKPSKRAAFN